MESALLLAGVPIAIAYLLGPPVCWTLVDDIARARELSGGAWRPVARRQLRSFIFWLFMGVAALFAALIDPLRAVGYYFNN